MCSTSKQKAGAGFVHDQDFDVLGNRLGNFDDLLFRQDNSWTMASGLVSTLRKFKDLLGFAFSWSQNQTRRDLPGLSPRKMFSATDIVGTEVNSW